MSKARRWHETPVSLHIAVEAPLSSSASGDEEHGICTNSGSHRHWLDPSLPFDATPALQILFFSAEGTLVRAAPLHVTVAQAKRVHSEASKGATVNLLSQALVTTTQECIMAAGEPRAAAGIALSPTLSGDTKESFVADMPLDKATGAVDEWTDAVDEEVMAFFDEE
ncbi:unspecified product [Leishmania tarentolae]|uniref:Unspecified product n=1 Tax=Leishmania tarentolae TaxID=5689 RepID=A0A640KNV2_LEITA|nr:unspecified product [Leishmania tarentolae]